MKLSREIVNIRLRWYIFRYDHIRLSACQSMPDGSCNLFLALIPILFFTGRCTDIMAYVAIMLFLEFFKLKIAHYFVSIFFDHENNYQNQYLKRIVEIFILIRSVLIWKVWKYFRNQLHFDINYFISTDS